MPPSVSARIQLIRSRLLSATFLPVSEEEAAEMKRQSESARHSNALEGIEPNAESDAFFDLMVELRVPADLRREALKWLHELQAEESDLASVA